MKKFAVFTLVMASMLMMAGFAAATDKTYTMKSDGVPIFLVKAPADWKVEVDDEYSGIKMSSKDFAVRLMIWKWKAVEGDPVAAIHDARKEFAGMLQANKPPEVGDIEIDEPAETEATEDGVAKADPAEIDVNGITFVQARAQGKLNDMAKSFRFAKPGDPSPMYIAAFSPDDKNVFIVQYWGQADKNTAPSIAMKKYTKALTAIVQSIEKP